MHTILIAEDDPISRIIVMRFLATYGYTVVAAANGVEALSMAQTEKPDLILMDMAMPMMSGWDVVPQLRAQAAFKTIPIVALTGYADDTERERCIDMGCTECLFKPARLPLLLETIQRLLGASETSVGGK